MEHVIAEHLHREHTQITHTKLNPVDIPFRHNVTNQIIADLKKRGFWNQCSVRVLYDAIRDIRGTDNRTIEKWIRELVRMGRIKRVNAGVFEIVG